MSYAPPAGTGLPFSFTGSAYTPPTGNALNGDFAAQNVSYLNPFGFTGGSGVPVAVNVSPTLVVAGINESAYGVPTAALKARQIITQWTGAEAMGAARASVPRTLLATGIFGTSFGSIYSVVNGFYSPLYGTALAMNFTGGYVPPSGAALPIDFTNTHVFRQLAPSGIAEGGVGSASVGNRDQGATVPGFTSFGIGAPTVANRAVVAQPPGFTDEAFGALTTILQHRFVTPAGIAVPAWNAANSGTVLNWVQPAAPIGTPALGFGTTSVVNATATQSVAPAGLAGPAFGAALVNPRTVFPVQFTASGYGTPNVQVPPHPLGIDSLAFGVPAVLDNHQNVAPAGLNAAASGLPDTRRLQEFVYPPSVLESALFGDARTILRQRSVFPSPVDDGFISPFAAVANRNREVKPFGFTQSVVPGNASAANVSPNLTPVGIAGPVFGSADVGAYYRTIALVGFSGAVGTASVKNAAATVAPAGLNALTSPPPMVAYRVRSMAAAGFTGDAYGAQTVWFRVRRLTGVGGSDTAVFGTARADLKDRRVIEVAVQAGAAYGAATTWFRVRSVAPDGIGYLVGKQFGATTAQDAIKHITLAGIAPGLAGTPAAARNEVLVKPDGIAAAYGSAFVDLAVRYVGPRSFLNEEIFGPATVYNARQYVAPFLDPDSALQLGAVGVPWSVENRNRIVQTFGFDMALLPNGGEAALKGRDIHPAGALAGGFGITAVSDRIRSVGPEGFDAFFARYSEIHNAAAVLEPSGIPRGFVGVPSIKDTRQFTDAVGGVQHTAFGTPFAAYAIRTVAVVPGMEEPRLAVQTVNLMRRYLAPPSIEGGAGVPTVESHRNLVNPKGYPMDSYGGARVANATPEVQVYPTLLTEYGRPGVFNRNSFVQPPGFGTLWGSATVDYRVKRVFPGPFEALRMSALNDVRFDAPQLPPQQTVNLDSATGGDGSIAPGIFGAPAFTLRGMIVPGLVATFYGRPTVVSYGIGPVTIPFDVNTQFGIPALNPTQYVAPQPVEKKEPNRDGGGEGAAFIGTLRITPYTVSLSTGAKPDNEVDYDPNGPHHPWFGVAAFTNHRRSIQHTHSQNEFAPIFGDADVQLLRRYVRPAGFKAFKYGVPSIPTNWEVRPFWGRTTEEEVPGVDIDPVRFGAPNVTIPVPPGPRAVFPQPTLGSFGQTRAELFNRTISNAGAIYGTVFTGDNWVHPPIKLGPVGFGSTAFGQLATGLKHRGVQVDSSDLDTHWGVEFNGGVFPMKVRLAYKRVTAAGIAPAGVGQPLSGHRQQVVAVPGGQNALVAAPIVVGRAKVAPAGFNSLLMGVPKQPVYGQIEPFGDDLAQYGRPGLNLGLHAPYIEPGYPGQPNVRRGVRVAGLTGEFGATVVIGESNCGSTLAVIPMLGDTSHFGQPEIHG